MSAGWRLMPVKALHRKQKTVQYASSGASCAFLSNGYPFLHTFATVPPGSFERFPSQQLCFALFNEGQGQDGPTACGTGDLQR